MERGILMAFGALTLWGLLALAYRFAGLTLGVDPVLFACLELVLSAVAMLFIAGFGKEGLESFKHPLTWVIGVSRVLIAIFFMLAVLSISTTEVYFLLRIYVVLGLLGTWAFFHRRPGKYDFIGSVIVISGFLTVLWHVNVPLFHTSLLATLGVAVLETVAAMCAEKHPVSNRTIGLRGRLRFTGMVLLVTSLAFLVFTAVMVYIPFVPSYEADFASTFTPQALALAFIIAVLLRAPAMYLYLMATRLAKSENVLMAATVGPFIVLGMESLLVGLGYLPASTFGGPEIIGGILITLGSLFMISMRLKTHKRNNRLASKEDMAPFSPNNLK